MHHIALTIPVRSYNARKPFSEANRDSAVAETLESRHDDAFNVCNVNFPPKCTINFL